LYVWSFVYNYYIQMNRLSGREYHLTWLKQRVESSGDINKHTGKKYETLLHDASSCNDMEGIKYLVEANADINIRDSRNNTPLHNTTSNYNPDINIVKYLVEHGASVSSVNFSFCTPLTNASKVNNIEIVKYLVECGAPIDYVDYHGQTSLHHAAINHSVDIMKYLVESGASLNIRDEHGNTPLHYISVGSESVDIIKFLLDNGADKYIMNNDGISVIEFCALPLVIDWMTRPVCDDNVQFIRSYEPIPTKGVYCE